MSDARVSGLRTEFDPGKVLGRSIGMVFGNLPSLFVIALVVFSPVYAGLALFFAGGLDFSTEESALRTQGRIETYERYQMIALILLQWVLTAAVIHLVVQRLRGLRVGLTEAISVGLKRMLPSLGAGLLQGLLVAGGFLLCIVPGLIWASTYWVTVPVCVVEKPGISASFSRSKALTQGIRWRVFAVLFCIGVVQVGLSMLLQVIGLSMDPGAGAVSFLLIGGLLLATVLNVWSAVASAVGYYEIRRAKENVDLEQLAAVFD